MTQEKIEKGISLQNEITAYELVVRYADGNDLHFTGVIGGADLSSDKELAKLIGDHCKKKQAELQKEFDEL